MWIMSGMVEKIVCHARHSATSVTMFIQCFTGFTMKNAIIIKNNREIGLHSNDKYTKYIYASGKVLGNLAFPLENET